MSPLDGCDIVIFILHYAWLKDPLLSPVCSIQITSYLLERLRSLYYCRVLLLLNSEANGDPAVGKMFCLYKYGAVLIFHKVHNYQKHTAACGSHHLILLLKIPNISLKKTTQKQHLWILVLKIVDLYSPFCRINSWGSW